MGSFLPIEISPMVFKIVQRPPMSSGVFTKPVSSIVTWGLACCFLPPQNGISLTEIPKARPSVGNRKMFIV